MTTAEEIKASAPALLETWRGKQEAWFAALGDVASAQENGCSISEMENFREREEATRQERNRAYWDYSRAVRGLEPVAA